MESLSDHSATCRARHLSLETLHCLLCLVIRLATGLRDPDLPSSQRRSVGHPQTQHSQRHPNRRDILHGVCASAGDHRVLSGVAGRAAAGLARLNK